MTDSRTDDSAVTAAELDEFLSQLRGNFWIPGTAREHKAADAIAALMADNAKKDAALRDIRERAVLMMSGRYTYCQLIIERCDAALAQPAPASPSPGLRDGTEPMPFERHPALCAHIQRMASTGVTGSGYEWSDFLGALNSALSRPVSEREDGQ